MKTAISFSLLLAISLVVLSTSFFPLLSLLWKGMYVIIVLFLAGITYLWCAEPFIKKAK